MIPASRARRTMPWSSGPAKNSGKMVMRSKCIGFQSNEWRSGLSCTPSNTRQPARHFATILFILLAEFRLEPRLLDEQNKQIHGHEENHRQIYQSYGMKHRRLSEHHKGNAPIHRIAHNPIRPRYNQLLRWIERQWRAAPAHREAPERTGEVQRDSYGDKQPTPGTCSAHIRSHGARQEPIRHQHGPKARDENGEDQRSN